MTKDNLGSESWQSDQETIQSLYKQLGIIADAERALLQQCGNLQSRITAATALVDRYGMTAGEHHQQWLIDQILRALLGEGYDAWVAAYNKPGYVTWDTGIAP